MSDLTFDLTPQHRHALVVEVDGPEEDHVLEVTVSESVVVDESGVDRGAPHLTVRAGADAITLTDRDQVLRLQAMINRAANQWREAATHLP